MNILDLPLEVLEKITSFIPDQLTFSQTCKTFYDISCRLNSYGITVGDHNFCDLPGINVNELEEDESFLQSIVNSKRRIKAMRLVDIDVPDLKYQKKSLKMLFEKFGHNLTKVRLVGCEMVLQQFVDRNDVPEGYQLNLPKLKELDIYGCSLEVLTVFNRLPDNVLAKVVISWCKGNADNVLKNQRKIKELTWKDSGHLAIDTRNLQLHSLELSKDCYSKELLTGQVSLNSLHLGLIFIEQADIDIISTLKQLVYLEFEIERFSNLSALRNLTKLKKLEVNNRSDSNQSLETLNSISVDNLTIGIPGFDSDLAIPLSVNCPNIRKLRIPCYDEDGLFDENSVGAFRLSSYLENFPKLESLSTTMPIDSNFPTDLVHRNLKRLYLENFSNKPGLRTLLESCVGLEIFETGEIDWKLLKVILNARPNLKMLCVDEVDKYNLKFMNTFWEVGKSLKSFHVKRISADEVENRISRKMKTINRGLPYMALMKAVKAKKPCCEK